MKRQLCYGEGPYNRCLGCNYLGNGCDGPRTSCMPLERWCHWCKDLKELRGYSNAYIAEQSGVHENTVSRIMACKATQDIMRDTAARIENVLIGSSRQWPCAMELNKEKEIVYMDTPQSTQMLTERAEEIARLQRNYETMQAAYERDIEVLKADYQAKIDYLKEQVASYAAQNEHNNKLIRKLAGIE